MTEPSATDTLRATAHDLRMLAEQSVRVVPAVELREVRERCAGMALRLAADTSDLRPGVHQVTFDQLIDATVTLRDRAYTVSAATHPDPEQDIAVGFLELTVEHLAEVHGLLLDAATIIGADLPLWVRDIEVEHSGMRPPTARELRYRAQRGFEVAGHGTSTYRELAGRFGWAVPNRAERWPSASSSAPLYSVAWMDEVLHTYDAQRGDNPSIGVLRWLRAVLDQPCRSCRAPAGAQCVRGAWSLPAHGSHKARLREARRALGWVLTRTPTSVAGDSVGDQAPSAPATSSAELDHLA